MIEFRVLIIDYLPTDEIRGDMETMMKKAHALKASLIKGPLVIFDDQITIEPNYGKEYVVVVIDKIPEEYLKKVYKKCKKIKPYSIKTNSYFDK